MNRNAFVLACLFGLAVAPNAFGADLPLLRHTGSGPLPNFPLAVAEKQGFFAREGIRVQRVEEPANGTPRQQGVLSSVERGGPADMVLENGGFFIEAVLNGSDTVAVGVQTANPVYTLVVRPEIRGYADLKGKTITMTNPWDGITLTARALLKQHGIGPNDFKFESIRNSDARLACMQKGDCAAIIAVQPFDTQAVNLGMGFHKLGSTIEAGPVTFYMEVVSRQWASTHRDLIVRYLRGIGDAMRFIHDPKNRAEVTKLMAEVTKNSPALVNELVANYADPKLRILPKQGEIDMASFNTLLQFAKDTAKDAKLWDKPFPPAERFVDLSYAKAAGLQ